MGVLEGLLTVFRWLEEDDSLRGSDYLSHGGVDFLMPAWRKAYGYVEAVFRTCHGNGANSNETAWFHRQAGFIDPFAPSPHDAQGF